MIEFKAISESDYPILLEWLQRPHVKEWWNDGHDTLDKVAASYSSDPDTTKRFIVELDSEARGYFQYYQIGSFHFGTDQFLANDHDLSTGIGTILLMAFIEKITDLEAVSYISVDPHPDNLRAVRCYEKCGFVHDVTNSKPNIFFMTNSLTD